MEAEGSFLLKNPRTWRTTKVEWREVKAIPVQGVRDQKLKVGFFLCIVDLVASL